MQFLKYSYPVVLLFAITFMSGCAGKAVTYSANNGLEPIVTEKTKPCGIYNLTAVIEIDNSDIKTIDAAKTAEATKEVQKAVQEGLEKRGFKSTLLERELFDEGTQKKILLNLNTSFNSPLIKTNGKPEPLIKNADAICKQKGAGSILIVKGIDYHQSAGRRASEAAKTVLFAVLGSVRTVSKAYTNLQVMLLDCEGRQVFTSTKTDTGVNLTSSSDAESFIEKLLEDFDDAIEKQKKKG